MGYTVTHGLYCMGTIQCAIYYIWNIYSKGFTKACCLINPILVVMEHAFGFTFGSTKLALYQGGCAILERGVNLFSCPSFCFF